ncbi:MAG: peptidylprolyl isomerase [Flammeovirgaceae bacterium]
MLVAEIHTDKGLLDFELYAADAPKTVEHFRTLVEQGFYDGLEFFKFIPGVLLQTGCPNNNGTGGCGYFAKCELQSDQKHDFGVLSMAHTTRNGNGSQFFICLSRNETDIFDGNHTCFGGLRNKGFDVLQKLREGDKVVKIVVENIEE